MVLRTKCAGCAQPHFYVLTIVLLASCSELVGSVQVGLLAKSLLASCPNHARSWRFQNSRLLPRPRKRQRRREAQTCTFGAREVLFSTFLFMWFSYFPGWFFVYSLLYLILFMFTRYQVSQYCSPLID